MINIPSIFADPVIASIYAGSRTEKGTFRNNRHAYKAIVSYIDEKKLDYDDAIASFKEKYKTSNVMEIATNLHNEGLITERMMAY